MFAAFLSGLALMLFLSNGGVWRSLLCAAIGAAVAALVELVSKEGTYTVSVPPVRDCGALAFRLIESF